MDTSQALRLPQPDKASPLGIWLPGLRRLGGRWGFETTPEARVSGRGDRADLLYLETRAWVLLP